MANWSQEPPLTPAQDRAGFRAGSRGTHTSRTIMLAELTDLLDALPPAASRQDYFAAATEANLLGKSTAATRRLTDQRLGELYGLDPGLTLFRVMRRLWPADPAGRPLLALLRATAAPVLTLTPGAELVRATFLDALRVVVGSRLNDNVLDKVARNAASSWSQSGHLSGRMRKIRQRVTPTPGAAAYALWLGSLEGLAGESLLSSRWASVLDVTGRELLPVVLQAKQLGFVHARAGGGVIEIDVSRLDKSTPMVA